MAIGYNKSEDYEPSGMKQIQSIVNGDDGKSGSEEVPEDDNLVSYIIQNA